MKTRIISAIIAIILAAVILILNNTIILNIAIALLTFLMLYEVFSAIKCKEYTATTIICYAFSIAMPLFMFNNLVKYRLLLLVISIFLVFLTYLFYFKTLKFEKLCVMLTTTILITLSMNSIISIKNSSENHGLFLLIISLCGAWFADSGAYFAGTLFGKHKLCPNISPKKTIEGLIGGMISNAALFVGVTYLYKYICSTNNQDISFNIFVLIALGVVCCLLGVLGDLSASLLKRQCNIKDYGNIMPGHGGALDRFDSVLFIAPFMYLVTNYIDIIK